MIKAIIGGVGSGKSLSLTKTLIDNAQLTYSNFSVNSDNVRRLKKSNIIDTKVEYGTRGAEKQVSFINWDFWNSVGEPFNLAFDEVHNVLHSRQSMTKWNTLMSIWFSQIRKILDNDEKHHMYLISQKIERIDVALRDLLHVITSCQCYHQMDVNGRYMTVTKTKYHEKYREKYPLRKMRTLVTINGKKVYKMLPVTWVRQFHFRGDRALTKYDRWAYGGEKTYDKSSFFLGNPYFKYYDSYELIKFGDDVYL